MLRITFVSPTYFAPESVLGGGERYAEELARAVARSSREDVRVRFVSFGPRELRERPASNLERVILRNWSSNPLVPFSPRLAGELADADVLHAFQWFSLPTFLTAWWGRKKRVFVSDLGGGAWTPGFHLDQERWVRAHLPISAYAARGGRWRRPHRVIHSGVDLERYPMRPAYEHNGEHDGSIVFLGRVLPHKGIHFLIEALPPDLPLTVIGTEGTPEYRARLESLAEGKRVTFLSGASDDEVRARLRRAMALVHPTPVDAHGSAGANELFGLALVEAMACGCPVIASNVASLPEIVEHEGSGLLVPPNVPAAITTALERLRGDGALWRRLSQGARARVEERFTWERVAARCLAAYAEIPPPSRWYAGRS